MTDYLKRTWAVINLDHIANNVNTIKQHLSGKTLLMAVVKADAYGHGDKFTAPLLAELGANWFGVSNIIEALSLRAQGITQPILIFGYTPIEYVATLKEKDLTQTVYSLEYAKALQQAAQLIGVNINIHIKIDSGMSRLGFISGHDLTSLIKELEEVCQQSHLLPEGIFTHFASADEQNQDAIAYTHEQYACFCQIVDVLKNRGITFRLRHCCNSAATFNYPEMHLDMVRTGVVLYGLNPNAHFPLNVNLKPVMSFYSCISMVKEIAQDTPIGYGRSYIANNTMRIASVPVGYADGYCRALSNQSQVLVKGALANVVGRISMDRMMIDVTHIPNAAPGDIVTLVGTDSCHTLTFDDIAFLSNTNSYERVAAIGKRVPRVYYQDNQEIGSIDLIEQHIQIANAS